MRISVYFILLVIAFFCFINVSGYTGKDNSIPGKGQKDAESNQISIIGVGDIMMGTNYPDASYLPANNGRNLLAPVEDILSSADVTFGNLEGVLLDEGGDVKRCNDPDLCYAFRSPVRYVDNLVNASFDMLSLANNHIGDFGIEGRRSTVTALEEAGIAYAGLQGYPTTIVEHEGVKVGMAAFSPFRGTLNMHDIDNAKRIVKELNERADIVVVSFHGGAEGVEHQNVICEDEYYYGENRGNVCKFSHSVIDAGADIVFGHGPHVTRAVELYDDSFIAYSLGNFCTYARFNLRGEHGIAPIIKVYVDKKGKFIEAKAYPVIQTGLGGPRLNSGKRAIRSLQRLTMEDFPETPLRIHSDGRIERIKSYEMLQRITKIDLLVPPNENERKGLYRKAGN